MKFICSAVKILLSDGTSKIIRGFRHADCWEQLPALGYSFDKNLMISGFLLEDNDKTYFVDRYEGAKIAKELGYKLEYNKVLYSEDIWP